MPAGDVMPCIKAHHLGDGSSIKQYIARPIDALD